MFNPLTKLVRAVRERGIQGTITQLYLIGDLKFGVLKGIDKFNNKYYEDLELPYGQHRWVEYSNIHNYDASMIQPEWHGWMHHVFDETPNEAAPALNESLATTTVSHASYSDHVGRIMHVDAKEQVDTSQYRQRGYRVGSLMTGPDDPDSYYLQPGHPLHKKVEKGGRFKNSPTIDHVDIGK